MSYLDNLENSLKALESREERDPAQVQREMQAREDARTSAAARAPFVRALKTSAFTGQLLGGCRKLGPAKGVYVQVTWVDEALRLEVREHRLQLTPTGEGVVAVYSEGGEERRREAVDLEADGEALAAAWLNSFSHQEAAG